MIISVSCLGNGHQRLLSYIQSLGAMFTRRRDQIWISRNHESAMNPFFFLLYNQTILNKAFNWTAAMSPNATFTTRSMFVDKKRSRIKSMEEVQQTLVGLNKTKTLCWVMSNCGATWTPRRRLAAKIIRVFPHKTHFWGRGMSCMGDVTDKIVNHGRLERSPEAALEVIKHCVFYLALENSNCSGYVTEKFSNALTSYAIPVVNGWPRSYQNLVPGSCKN